MNEFKKNLIKTSVTLMIIAGGASILVGATNALTAPIIDKNAVETERKQLAVVYGDSADSFIEWKAYSGDEQTKYKTENENGNYLSSISGELKYVTKVWSARKTKSGNSDNVSDEDPLVGYVARVYGKNGYGALDLLVGIKEDGSLSKLCIIEDSMSYKSKVESNYIDPYNAANDGAGKESALENVKCGATFAATIVKNGLQEAKKVCMKQVTSSSTAIVHNMDVEGRM